MSRGYEARRKAKRQQARPEPESLRHKRPMQSWRLLTFIPVLFIVATLAAVGFLGFGASNGSSKERVEQEVTELLAGIPQGGATLGAPSAPITLRLFIDLQCPTVKRFFERHLSPIIHAWVRPEIIKIEYRSLKTDTRDEDTFFRQEVAALAAGKQGKMWNFIQTFIRQQGQVRTGYATQQFLTDIAEQVPGLKRPRWRSDRKDPLLSKQVALGIYRAHNEGFRGTPSFLIGFTDGKVDRRFELIRREVEASLNKDIETLIAEDFEDVPTLGVFGA